MSAASPDQPVPVRDAATVLLLRDGERGVETFMLRRNPGTVFGPGAYVFPGGAVEPRDADIRLYRRCDGLDDAEASARLGVARDGLAFWTAAIRECFEEAGVLIATDANGNELPAGRDLCRHRDALNRGECGLADVCCGEALRLSAARLTYYSHWITPPGEPRRFATRFFACLAPTGQDAAHDGAETVAGGWVRPADALRRHRRGDFPMMPPTVMQLRFLRAFSRAAAVLDALAGIAAVPTVTGRLVERGGQRRFLMSSRIDVNAE